MLNCLNSAGLPLGAQSQSVLWRDEFPVCNTAGCINGGIRTSSWSFDIGDGSDNYVAGEVVLKLGWW
jgi:hypothetical protein